MTSPVPRVSIGLPVHNGENYLCSALDSILRQDYSDFELIISDNASTDATQDICREHVAKDHRIRYYRNETNIGASANFNYLVKLARGEYFKWAAHDDVHLQGFLRCCVEVIEHAPATVVLVTPKAEAIDENGEILFQLVENLDTRQAQPYQRVGDVLRSVLWAPAQFGLFRTDALRKTRLIQPFFATDYVLLVEVALMGEIWELPDTLFQRRKHPGISTTANKKPRDLRAWFDPSQRGLKNVIPPRLRLALEYFRSIARAQLSWKERFLCYLTVFKTWFPRECRLYRNKIAFRTRLKRLYDGVPGEDCFELTNIGSKLKVGDLVEVRSKEAIQATLDKQGRLDGLPFMPQMFQYCGKRFKVYKRAHKTCDTVFPVRGRRMANAVHLETRCTGLGYDGCQAGCLIFWKETWLKKVSDKNDKLQTPQKSMAIQRAAVPQNAGCTEQDVWAGTFAPGQQNKPDPAYVCQATQLPYATTQLCWWDVRQYIEDYTSGNTGLWQVVKGGIYATYYNLSKSRFRLGRIMRWFYDKFHPLWRGTLFPRHTGTIPIDKPTPTPPHPLNLQPGELVRVKSHLEILKTLNAASKNRGLYFDAEMVPYCGGTYRVLRRVNRILDEKTGKMTKMKNESIILDGVYCQARYSHCRMFCPRAIYPYWREIWLERVSEVPTAFQPEVKPVPEISRS